MRTRQFIMAAFVALSPSFMSAQSAYKTGLTESNFDREVSPKSDFYLFANGGWLKSVVIPSTQARYDAFTVLSIQNAQRLNAIFKDITTKNYAQGTIEQKIGDLYRLAMDSVRRNREGVAPILPILNKINNAQSKEELFDIDASMLTTGIESLLGFYPSSDFEDSKHYILNVAKGHTTVEGKDFYMNEQARKLTIDFIKHIVAMTGYPESQATQIAQVVFNIESYMVMHTKTETESRDLKAQNNKMSLTEVQQKYPSIPWAKYFGALGLDKSDTGSINITDPYYVSCVDTLAASMSVDEYKSLLISNVLTTSCIYLSDDFVSAAFDFGGKTLMGLKTDRSRWEKAVSTIQLLLGPAIGKLYVERYFNEASKARVLGMIDNIKASMSDRIKAQKWMSETTKKSALEKLNTLIVMIGYPDQWPDYGSLTISPQDSYYTNIERCLQFRVARDIAKLKHKVVDRREWPINPQDVNAANYQQANKIIFPTAILQKPFFDEEADDAYNYGAIGEVIAHEVTHGYDDQGRHLDKNGNMNDWWTVQDAKNFEEQANRYADYFSTFEPLPGRHVNGRLTLGENIADHGGLMVAYHALEKQMKKSPLPTANGMTPQQRFFIAYANIWASKGTNEFINYLLDSEVHSWGSWRVNGSLPHIDAWYEAFGVKPGDKMYIPKEKRFSIW